MKPNNKYISITLLCLLTTLLIFSTYALTSIKAESFNKLSNQIIRLHIIANSNSTKDQQLKLKVRDQVISYIKDNCDSIENVTQAEAFLRTHTQEIIQLANEVLSKNDCSDKVNAYLTSCYFPDKTYDNTVFPAGTYNAYRIEIGKAEGHNWWCVLYPPLCFINQTTCDLPIDENIKKNIPQTNTASESPDTSYEDTDDYEIRFKLFDIFFNN